MKKLNAIILHSMTVYAKTSVLTQIQDTTQLVILTAIL